MFNNESSSIYCLSERRSQNLDSIKEWSDLLQRHTIAWIIALICTLISIGLSAHLISRHFKFYHQPQYQRHIVRILLMVPIYSICSFFSLIYYDDAVYFDVTKNCYEAFVIYSFFVLLLAYLGPDEESQLAAMSEKEVRPYPFPFGCFKFDPKKSSFLVRCKRMTLQYVIIRPVTTIIAVILQVLNLLCADEAMTPHRPVFWLTLIEMASVSVAMYGLILFYVVVGHDEIVNYGPIPKFVAVKFVIFFSFWQSIAISGAVSMGLITPTDAYSTSNISTSLQAFLICVEMVIASILHIKAFSYKPYEPEDGTRTPLRLGIFDSLNFRDWVEDVNTVMKKDAALDDETFIRLKNASMQHVDSLMEEGGVSPNKRTNNNSNTSSPLTTVGFDLSNSLSSKQKTRNLKKENKKYAQIAMDVLSAHEWEQTARMEQEENDFPDLFDATGNIINKAAKKVKRAVNSKQPGDYVNLPEDNRMDENMKAAKFGSVGQLDGNADNDADGSGGAVGTSYNYSYVPTVTFDDKDEA